MARRDNKNYNNRSLTFSKALDEVMTDKKKVYYLRLIKYFENCLKEEDDPDLIKKYEKVINKLAFSKKIADGDIGLIFGVVHTTVARWHTFANPKLPPLDIVVTLAEIFEVTSDYLLGLAGTPDIKTEERYKVFQHYGLNPKSFQNIDIYYLESYAKPLNEKRITNYKNAIAALNYLVGQYDDKNGYMDILTCIGYFLKQKKFDSYYYFDRDDVNNLFDGLFNSIDSEKKFSPDFVKEYLNSFLSDSPQFSIVDSVLISLDDIRDKLKAYKMQLSPDFFDKPTNSRQFFEPNAELSNKENKPE